jgi:DNA-binding IclR family transcriptional regulator
LEYLGGQSKEVGVRELGQAIGLSKSSVHRILQTLRARGFVKWNPDNARYSLGIKAFEVGCGIIRSLEAHGVAKAALEQLVATLGETAFLAVPADGGELVYVDKIDGRRSGRMLPQIGARRPMHTSGLGKALLAQLERSEVDRILSAQAAARDGNKTPEPDELLQQLETIRRQGYAEDDEETAEGMYSVGAPLFDYSGRAVAAISVAIPKSAQQPPERVVKLVEQTAKEISSKLGFNGRPKINGGA